MTPLSPWKTICYGEIDSTMDEADRLLNRALGPEERLAVFAETQTRGRGRYNRIWQSRLGNMHLTLLFRPNVVMGKWPQLAFVTSLAMRETVDGLLNNAGSVTLKWPNDILASGKKICGILLEIARDSHGREWIKVGIGLNVEYVPEISGQNLACIKDFGVEAVEAKVIHKQALQAFDRYYSLWIARGFGCIRGLWLEHASFLGAKIRINLKDSFYDGRFLDLDTDGRIMIESENGTVSVFSAGDVFVIDGT